LPRLARSRPNHGTSRKIGNLLVISLLCCHKFSQSHRVHLEQPIVRPRSSFTITNNQVRSYLPSIMTNSTTSPRVLTCAFNRRRNRVSPHFETDWAILKMTTQANSSKSMYSSGKPPRGEYSKLYSLASASENVDEWTEKRCCDDEVAFKASLSVDSSDEFCREGDDTSLSIFREIADGNDQEDMMMLKRANPVYDSDDEDHTAAPTKRQRTTTTSSSTVLSWSSQLSTDPSGGFSIRLQRH
jgi:hypothetical protein